MWQLTESQISQLESVRARVAFRHHTGTSGGTAEAVLIDTATGQRWARGRGQDESKALDAALAKANPGERPRTPAELAAENAALREQLAAAQAGEPVATVQPNEQDTPPDTPPDTRVAPGIPTDPEQEDWSDVTPKEMAKMLDNRGIEHPDGDKRTAQWREDAIARLRKHRANQ